MREQTSISHIEDPPLAVALFSDTRWAWIWLIVRVYVGWTWLEAGLGKLTSPNWVGAHAGSFLTIWLTKAVTKSVGPHADVEGWYAWVLQNVVLAHAAFWSVAVTLGECTIGIALILGLFTGIAAFFGTILNESYLLAGTVSINPILLPLGTFLVLAWKTAGWWGIDRWLLPRLGTPWKSHHAADVTAPSTS